MSASCIRLALWFPSGSGVLKQHGSTNIIDECNQLIIGVFQRLACQSLLPSLADFTIQMFLLLGRCLSWMWDTPRWIHVLIQACENITQATLHPNVKINETLCFGTSMGPECDTTSSLITMSAIEHSNTVDQRLLHNEDVPYMLKQSCRHDNGLFPNLSFAIRAPMRSSDLAAKGFPFSVTDVMPIPPWTHHQRRKHHELVAVIAIGL